MTSPGVILYGPPAAGKDTITAQIIRKDERFAAVTKLKAGTGRATGYRPISPADMDALRTAGRLLVETRRYGNRYALDRTDLDALTSARRIPIVHIGNLTDLHRLRESTGGLDWTSVLLWIPRHVCATRSRQRGDADHPQRLQAWDEMAADLSGTDTATEFDLSVHTDQISPDQAARQIIDAIKP